MRPCLCIQVSRCRYVSGLQTSEDIRQRAGLLLCGSRTAARTGGHWEANLGVHIQMTSQNPNCWDMGLASWQSNEQPITRCIHTKAALS